MVMMTLHVVVLNYEDTESLGKGRIIFCTSISKVLAKTSEFTEPVEQSLNMKLISGGNYEPENNQVYTIYRMKVDDAAAYAKAYSKVTKAQEELEMWLEAMVWLKWWYVNCTSLCIYYAGSMTKR